ncbi:hypothetical protein [Egicoccus sp. AB-alg2]|uniref:hypothetical protein n=1 Tax=Egicoccus sp. AB-alg2 TaxID=3242693 RepID=UPI00359E60E7
MRLSEKTIELNFCHQMSLVLGQPSWWFGTTQRQERDLGWDVAGHVAGRWVKFQLKASNEVLTNGRRRFRGHHEQLVELQAQAAAPGEPHAPEQRGCRRGAARRGGWHRPADDPTHVAARGDHRCTEHRAHLRDVQDFARHADPKTTMRYDRNRHSLDRHATYAIAQYIAGSE